MSNESTVNNPFTRFDEVFARAEASGTRLPNAATLATTGRDGQPSARVMLLKGVDEGGFVFYTNMRSRKAQELIDNPKAALCFYWSELDAQVRVEGAVGTLDDEEADAYFATRPRGSQIGAWASPQSTEIPSRDTLVSAVAEYDEKFKDQPVPRPAHWSGFRLVPTHIEFWEGKPDRLHERYLYTRTSDGWKMSILAP